MGSALVHGMEGGLRLLVGIFWFATLWHIFRGSRTFNDGAMALGATLCFAVPAGLGGGISAGALSPGIRLGALALLAAQAFFQLAIFHVADQRRNLPEGWIFRLEQASQPAYAFSLWAALFLAFRLPVFALGSRGWTAALDPGAWLLAPALLTAWGTAWTFRFGPRLRIVDLPVLPAEVPEVRIAHLSDIHYAAILPDTRLRRILESAYALEPDLVAITGDLVMPFSEDHHDGLLRELGRGQRPVFACTGNHDLPVASSLARELEAQGVALLRDAAREITVAGHRLRVVGLDHRARAAATPACLAQALPPADDDGIPEVLLLHDPRLVSALPRDRFPVVLSGHTHGGQVSLEMFGIPWSPLSLLGVPAGGLRCVEGRWQYVHRGNLQLGVPPRLGVAEELVLLRLLPREPSQVARSRITSHRWDVRSETVRRVQRGPRA